VRGTIDVCVQTAAIADGDVDIVIDLDVAFKGAAIVWFGDFREDFEV
jgi:hypothetical protein